MTESQREMVAVMFTDVSGYSALAQQNEALALRLLEIKRTIADPVIAEYHGHLIKTIGDALMVEFKSALDAARCAAALQQRLYEHNLVVPAEQQISVRIGVHMGDVVRKDGDIFGDTVNIAARVEPQAPPGGIAVTHAVYEQIRNKFELPLSGLGSFHLKGIEGGTVLYAVVLPWGPVHPQAQRRRAVPLRLYAGIGAALLAAVAGLGLWRSLARHEAGSPAAAPAAATVAPPQSVAVLPFENLSGDPNNAYFSAGIQDEILTRLAQIGALKVVSRTSTLKYASHPENLKSVGLELGVAAVLEGSVQRAGDTARINVQLIDTATDTHLWAETYDRSLKDIFSAENDVAAKIADALKAKLQPQESARIAVVPTHDAGAYDLYLQAEYLFRPLESGEVEDDKFDATAAKAIQLYTKAIERDPKFLLAYAHRARTQVYTYWTRDSADASLLSGARQDAEHALALGPSSPDAHLAQGYVYYFGYADYAKALLEYDQVARDFPNDVEVILAIALVHRRLGDTDIIADFRRAEELDPHNLDRYIAFEVSTDLVGKRYADALAAQDRDNALFPGDPRYFTVRAYTLLLQGRLHEAREALDHYPPERRGDSEYVDAAYELAYLERKPDAMLEVLAPYHDEMEDSGVPTVVLRARALRMALRQPEATTAFASGEAILLAALKKAPRNPDLWNGLARVQAFQGRKADAIQSAQRAMSLTPMAKDALNGAKYVYGLAEVQAINGDVPAALESLEPVLSGPHGDIVSVAWLKLNPDWDAARGDPRFIALLEKYASSEH